MTKKSELGEVIAKIESGKSLVGVDQVDPNGFSVLKISAITRNGFKSDELKPLPQGYVPPTSHILKDGDLIFSRANTSELVGLACIVEKAPSNVALPDKLWRLVKMFRFNKLKQIHSSPHFSIVRSGGNSEHVAVRLPCA